MARCSDISPMLGGFEDGELEAHQMHEVARHLAQCKACEAELAENAALGQCLRATAVEPVLDGFTEAVQARLSTLTPPIYVRVRRYLDAAREQVSTAFALTAAGLATAALTAVILTPYAYQVASSRGGAQVQPAVPPLASIEAPVAAQFAHRATVDTPLVISGLESGLQPVGVWDEPGTHTTVIWVPYQR